MVVLLLLLDRVSVLGREVHLHALVVAFIVQTVMGLAKVRPASQGFAVRSVAAARPLRHHSSGFILASRLQLVRHGQIGRVSQLPI